MTEPITIAKNIAKMLDSKKALDIKLLEVKDLTMIADYFLIATGNSSTQLKALCDYVEEEMEKADIRKSNKEGYSGASWILLGYDGVIVHLFLPETRDFYDLEHVWQDAQHIDLSDVVTAEA